MATRFIHIEDRLVSVELRKPEVRGEEMEADVLDRRGNIRATGKGKDGIEATRNALREFEWGGGEDGED